MKTDRNKRKRNGTRLAKDRPDGSVVLGPGDSPAGPTDGQPAAFIF